MLGAQLSGSSSSVRQEGTQVEEVATDATGSVSHGQEGNCRSSSLNHHHHRHHPCGSLLWAKYQSNIKSSQTLHSKGSGGPERFINLPKVTQPISGKI